MAVYVELDLFLMPQWILDEGSIVTSNQVLDLQAPMQEYLAKVGTLLKCVMKNGWIAESCLNGITLHSDTPLATADETRCQLEAIGADLSLLRILDLQPDDVEGFAVISRNLKLLATIKGGSANWVRRRLRPSLPSDGQPVDDASGMIATEVEDGEYLDDLDDEAFDDLDDEGLDNLDDEDLDDLDLLHCTGCDVPPGSVHKVGCPMEQCPYCGLTKHDDHPRCPFDGDIPMDDRLPWDGCWPGTVECEEFGWYAYLDEGELIRCDPDDPGAVADVTRLPFEGVWSRKKKRWFKKRPRR